MLCRETPFGVLVDGKLVNAFATAAEAEQRAEEGARSVGYREEAMPVEGRAEVVRWLGTVKAMLAVQVSYEVDRP